MRRAFVTAAVAVGLALGAAAPAFATTDFFYPNTTQDVTHGSPDCSQSPVSACSLRDAISLANQDSNDADVFLQAGAVYPLTQGTSLRTDSRAHLVTITGDNATIDASGNGSTNY